MKFRTRVKRLRKKVTLQNVLSLLLICTAATLLLFQLGSIHDGLAAGESQLPPVTRTIEHIWSNPIELPYLISQFITAALLPTAGYTASRLPSVLLAAVTLALMYWVLVQWYGRRLAIFGIALLMSAASFLHVARLATPDILYSFCTAVILALAAWWHKNSRPRWLVYATTVSAGLLLYIPGALWLLLGGLIFERKHILLTIKSNAKDAVLAGILGLLTLVPLIHYLINDTSQYKNVLGIAGNIEVAVFLREATNTWQYLFIGGYENPLYNVATLPLLSVFTTISFFVGIYLYSKHPHAARTKLLLYLSIVSTILIALPSSIHISLLIPVITVLAVGGIGYLLHVWLTVFPKNPLARSFGIGIVGVVLAFTVIYNLANYFVAWSNNDQVQRTFSKRL